MSSSGSTPKRRRFHTGGAFDVRTVIAALMVVYGVVLFAMGLFGTTDDDLARADGVNVNLWTGVGLLAGALVFYGWSKWRPVKVPVSSQSPTDPSDTDQPRSSHESRGE
jgi:hypothetical protein